MKTVCFWILRSIPLLEKPVGKTLNQNHLKGTELKRQWGQATLLRQLRFRDCSPQGHFCREGAGPYLNLGSGLVASLEKSPGDKIQGLHSTDHLMG